VTFEPLGRKPENSNLRWSKVRPRRMRRQPMLYTPAVRSSRRIIGQAGKIAGQLMRVLPDQPRKGV
jgi:hypothetical protein